MTIPGTLIPLFNSGAAAGGYSISRSLRFNSSDSAYLSRTPSSAGNRKTWTYSFWFKLGKVTGYQYFLSANDPSGSGSNYDILQMDNNASTIVFFGYNGSSFDWLLSSNAVFRDPSAWQHFAIAFDTTQSTASNRVKWWHNGNLLDLNRSGYTTYPSLNAESRINNTVSQRISDQTYGLNSYLADIHFIDGQALDPTSFGETDATTGVWVPKAYSGTYGTNGFHLEFADNSAATAAALGKDTSGNGLNWTPNNLSVTAGAGNDSLVDVPTNGSQTDTGVGAEVRGNYCTWNPLDKSGSPTYSNGNLDASTGASNYGTTRGTIAVSSGKWYWECTFNSTDASNDCYFGILDITGSLADYLGGNAKGYAYWAFNGNKVNNGSSSAYGSSYAPGDVIGVALNLDAGSITFYKNGVNQGTAFTSLSGTFAPAFSDSGSSNIGLTGNFGQRPFAYTAPSGFKALCTANLPAPVITKPSTVMDVLLYSGTGSAQTISGLGFNPDLVWVKGRSGAAAHTLVDAVRGVNSQLFSNLTVAQESVTDAITAFNSNGFSVGVNTSGTYPHVNVNGYTYVAWTWDAGSSTVSNTQGSITSSVRANASAGFSIVTYTGNGTAGATVGHGLGVAPVFIIHKCRSTAVNWFVYHGSAGTGAFEGLNTTAAYSSASGAFGNTAPTSTVFTTGGDTNTNGRTYVNYCFAPVAGYTSMGSFSGGSGVFVYTGFRPRWLLLKQSSATSAWIVYDTARDTYNAMGRSLYPNLSDAEYDSPPRIDFVSNGFVTRAASASEPSWTGTVIYFAIAESSFNYARAR